MSIDAVTHAEKRGDDGTTLREASIGRVMGIDWFMGQNVYQHTAGTFSGGTPAVNSVVAAGETIMDIDGGAAAETIKAGDVFTVAGHDGWYGVFTADKTASTGVISGATFTPRGPGRRIRRRRRDHHRGQSFGPTWPSIPTPSPWPWSPWNCPGEPTRPPISITRAWASGWFLDTTTTPRRTPSALTCSAAPSASIPGWR